jgi:hypothetical protein
MATFISLRIGSGGQRSGYKPDFTLGKLDRLAD